MKTFVLAIASMLLLLAPVANASSLPYEGIPYSLLKTVDQEAAQSEVKSNDASIDSTYRVVITGDFGGVITDYIVKYNIWRQQNLKIRIDDVCISACTLVTGLIRPENVCTSEFGVLAFHSASQYDHYSPEGTRLLWQLYPNNVKDALITRGWKEPSEHPDLLYIPATVFYKRCKD